MVRMSGRFKLKIFLTVFLLVVTSVVSGIWYFSYYIKTPDYSLKMIQEAVAKHDMAKFQKYVDMDHLLSTSCDALMQGLIDSERPMPEEARIAVSGFTKMFKSPLVMSFKGIINHYIESGEWSDDASKSADQGIPIDSDIVLSKSGLKNTCFRKIDYVAVDKDAGTAIVGIRVFQKEAGEEFVLKVAFVQTDEGVWRAYEVENFHDFITFIMNARHIQLQTYIEDTSAIMLHHDKSVKLTEKKISDLLAAGSLGNTATRNSIKEIVQGEMLEDWTGRKEELDSVDVPASAQSLHRLRLKICDLHIAYAGKYAAWMDDKQALTIRSADENLKEAKTLEHEAAIMTEQMKNRTSN
jgi:hypothetical protein